MTQAQQDALQAVLGDEKAKVSVARDIGSKHYGNGGSVWVQVTITCGQDALSVYNAGELANGVAENMLEMFFPKMVDHCKKMGV